MMQSQADSGTCHWFVEADISARKRAHDNSGLVLDVASRKVKGMEKQICKTRLFGINRNPL